MPVSSVQLNVAGSFAANVNVAVVELVKPLGPEVMKLVPPPPSGSLLPPGGVVSIVHVRDTTALVFPAGSVARTEKVCEPEASPVYDAGEVQAAHEPPSSLHSNVEPVS